MEKNEKIRSGLDALFGGSDSPQEPSISHNVEAIEEVEHSTEEEENELIDSIEDDELKTKLIERRAAKKEASRNKEAKKTSADGYSRTSLIINEEKYAKIKEIAFRSTLTTKVVVEAAFDLLIERYEEKHGEVVPNPKKYKGDVKDLFK